MKSNTRAIIERKIGYRFNNPDLLRQAFVRKSYANEHGGQHNEVLEHFGDAALNFAVKRYLFERYGSWTELSKDYNYRIDRNEFVSLFDEGKLTAMAQKIVKNSRLATCIERLDLARFLIMNSGEIKQRAATKASVKANLFEAIVGAVAIDCYWNSKKILRVVKKMLGISNVKKARKRRRAIYAKHRRKR